MPSRGLDSRCHWVGDCGEVGVSSLCGSRLPGARQHVQMNSKGLLAPGERRPRRFRSPASITMTWPRAAESTQAEMSNAAEDRCHEQRRPPSQCRRSRQIGRSHDIKPSSPVARSLGNGATCRPPGFSGTIIEPALEQAMRVSVIATGIDQSANRLMHAQSFGEPVLPPSVAPASLGRTAGATEFDTPPLLAPVIPFPEPTWRRQARDEKTHFDPPAIRRLLDRFVVAASERRQARNVLATPQNRSIVRNTTNQLSER
jgi:hypothetical protein